LQSAKFLKKILYLVMAVLLITMMYYLYRYQLGAISFFLLSIFFFVLSIRQFTNSSDEKKKPSKK
jgi:preprotein translocase subunit SecG